MRLRIDMSRFTIGDAIDLEEAGFSMADLVAMARNGKAAYRLAAVVVWIFTRKDDPAFTLEDAKALAIAELEIDYIDAASPKDPGSDGASGRSASPRAGRPTRSPR